MITITKEEPKDGLKEFRGIQLLKSEIQVLEAIEKWIKSLEEKGCEVSR